MDAASEDLVYRIIGSSEIPSCTRELWDYQTVADHSD